MAMMPRLVQQRLDARLREAPPARIQRLLLRPHDVLRVRIHVQVLSQLFPGERVELLDSRDGRVLDALVGPVLVQRDVGLARADDDAGDFVGGVDVVGGVRGVRDDPLEVGVAGEVGEGGAGEGVAEEGFGEENRKGLGKVSVRRRSRGTRACAYAFGTDGSFGDVERGRGWREWSCRRSACCSLGAVGLVSLPMGRYVGLRCRVAGSAPSCPKSAQVLGRRNREAKKGRDPFAGTT